jgi:hypothetical protein
MARCSRRHIDGASVALATYAVVCCAITVCLAFGFYQLMQPARFANPGLAAYKAPPGAVMNLVDLAPPAPPPELITTSIAPPAPTLDTSSSPQRQTNPKTARAKSERPQHQRAARVKQRRDPMMHYAFQPSFGSYRSSW